MLLATGSFACSCFGPSTVCGTLDPPYPNPEWWIPDVIILGVKQANIAHGMDVKVLEVFSGAQHVHEEQVIRVWGDCGFACRVYPDTWAVGDTVVWSFQFTDLSGNSLCPGDALETEGEFMISVCGIYWLTYDHGTVSGPITAESEQSMSIADFREQVTTCLSTGISERATTDPLEVRYSDGQVWLSLGAPYSVDLAVMDAMGRTCLLERWNGTKRSLDGFAHGTYIVQVSDGDRRWRRKVVLP